MLRLLFVIIRYWDLIIALAVKDLKVRYKSAFLGFLWAILTPLFLAIIFFIVFTKIIPMGIDRYPIFLLCALFPWNFMQVSLSMGTVSIVTSGNLIKKVYFPREVIPISVVFSNAYNLVLSFLILILAIVLSCGGIKPPILLLPFIVICQIVFTLGLLFIFSGLHTYYRDVKYMVEIFTLGWFYLTPIFYPIDLIPISFRKIYMFLNPMAIFVDFYRGVMLYGAWPNFFNFMYIVSVSIVMYFIGLFIFKKYEPLFADVV